MLIINISYIFFSFIKNYINNGFKYYKIYNLKKIKKSNTLVILGAGSTINDLTIDQLKLINEYDVAGLSYSCVLPIVQNFYFYESPSYYEHKLISEHVQKVYPAIIRSSEKGFLPNLLWKNSENKILNRHMDFKNFSKPIVVSILSNNLKVIKFTYGFFKKLRLHKYFLIQKRGSVTALIQFSQILEYEKVIFVGVDLIGRYFFEDSDEYNSFNFSDPNFPTTKKEKGAPHRTNDSSLGLGVTIDEVIRLIVHDSKITKFYTSSSKSVLSEFIPVWCACADKN